VNCIKCGGQMELGLIADIDHSTAHAQQWYAGAIKWSFWGGLSLSNRRSWYVRSMRCKKCGYLESYAS